MDEIKKCSCGADATVRSSGDDELLYYWVECPCGEVGLDMCSREAAVQAWNEEVGPRIKQAERCVCGGVPEVHEADIYDENLAATDTHYHVSCTACHRTGPEMSSKKLVVEIWNEWIATMDLVKKIKGSK